MKRLSYLVIFIYLFSLVPFIAFSDETKTDIHPAIVIIANIVVPGTGHLLVGETGKCALVSFTYFLLSVGVTIVGAIISRAISNDMLSIVVLCVGIGMFCLAPVYLISDTVFLYKKIEAKKEKQ